MQKKANSKVALVFIGNIEYCPYIREYIRILESKRLTYNVLFWERQELTHSYPSGYIPFRHISLLNKKKYQKAWGFLAYGWWLKKHLKKGAYSHYVFLDTLSGMLAYLLRMTNGMPAVLEIRDHTLENIPLFRHIERHLFAHMQYCFISSAAFRNFLSPWNFTVTHNINSNEYLNSISRYTFKRKSHGPYNLVYAGAIKYYNYQVSIINEFKNNKDFRLIYHGVGPDYERLQEYCHESHIYNITFTGRFKDADKPNLYQDADFLINCYDIRIGDEIRYAISNKFYDGLIYHVPQLVESGSYKGELVSSNHIGITWVPDEGQLADKIIDFYRSLDEYTFNDQCIKLMKHYYDEYSLYTKQLLAFFSDGICP